MPATLVPTTAGPIFAADLGFTLMHEHVAIYSPGLRRGFPFLYDEVAIHASAVARLREAKAAGVATIVDVTTVDLGREADLVARAADEAEINVVLATGIWIDVPRYVSARGPADAADIFKREIDEGVDGGSIRAGIIKVASDEEVTPAQEIVLRGAARAGLATGVAVTTHTLPGARTGLRQLQILADEGFPPDRTIIGHSSCIDDEYVAALYASGCTVGWDQFGTTEIGDEDSVTTALVAFLRQGLASRTVLSGDFGAFVDWDAGLNHSYAHVPTVVIPALREAGVSEEDIRAMTVDAPARLLAPV